MVRDNIRDDDTNSFQKYPPAKEVDQFHRNADTDKRSESIHHTLGRNKDQASPGDHVHDGGASQLLFPVLTFNDNVGTLQGKSSALAKIIQALVPMGATDNTTSSGLEVVAAGGSNHHTFPSPASRYSAALTIAFPIGLFTSPPNVQLTSYFGDTSGLALPTPVITANPTTISFTSRSICDKGETLSGQRSFTWLAVGTRVIT